MKQTAKFSRDGSFNLGTGMNTLTKESPMVAKAKHMLFVNHNAEKVFDETVRDNFDF